MSKLTLTYTGTPYFDRIQPVIDERVSSAHVQVRCNPSWNVVDLFVRVVREAEFEMAEMSMCTALMMLSRGDDRYVLLPIFPSRAFRQSQIYVNTATDIRRPVDLKGKTVGILDYQATAGLWIRGILEDEYRVRPSDIRWRLGGVETPGYKERLKFEPPDDVNIEKIGANQTLVQCLEDGDIDALFGVRAPSNFRAGSPSVKRLFENYRAVEQAYFERTSLFPIMHGVVLRRDIYEKHPWVVRPLLDVFYEAKKVGRSSLADADKPAAMHPWLPDEVDQVNRLFGGDPFPYGLPRNRKVLQTMIRYGFEQGLLAGPLNPSDLFPAEVLDWDEPEEADWSRV